MQVAGGWSRFATVESQSTGEEHRIALRNKSEQLGCSCKDWIFRKQKTGELCKHQTQVIEALAGEVRPAVRLLTDYDSTRVQAAVLQKFAPHVARRTVQKLAVGVGGAGRVVEEQASGPTGFRAPRTGNVQSVDRNGALAREQAKTAARPATPAKKQFSEDEVQAVVQAAVKAALAALGR